MNKLLHERLRGDGAFVQLKTKSYINLLDSDFAAEIADEIEKCYVPRPRFENGEPVQFGDEVEDGTIHEIAFWDDGTILLLDETPETIYEVSAGCFIKRPESKVLDADGVETNAWDTVYTKLGIKCTVEKIGTQQCEGMEDWDGTPWVMFDNGSWMHAHDVTHREPDSLEKLRDDATKPSRQYYADHIGHDVGLKDDEEINTAVHKHIIDRAVAIMERDA